MYEWTEVIQKMIDWIEDNISNNPTLLEMSFQIGYSPFYCSRKFHEIVGMTLKSYIAGRRLCKATLEIRDTNERILDIAIKYGFSSQEALTRAFVSEYGCTPAHYRKTPKPINLSIKQIVYYPEHKQNKGECNMSNTILTDPSVRVEFIPAHKYIGIWDSKVDNYGSFWERHNCDDVCGIIDSISHVSHPIITCHTAGWFYENGKKGYFYGLGVPLDYSGEIPNGFGMKEFPESYYFVFSHPPFDYLKDNSDVMARVEKLAWNFDPSTRGYQWNEEVCQDYQRHHPEVGGYAVLRPIRKN